MPQSKIVNSIAIKTAKHGINEVLPVLAEGKGIDPIYEPESDAALLIEVTDHEVSRDFLIEIEFASHIHTQSRDSLYSGETDNNASKRELDMTKEQLASAKTDNDALFERNAEMTGELNDLNREIDELEAELAIAKEAKQIHSVEAWCYDRQGNVLDHYVLTSEDVGEEIPIGTAVISLRREFAEEGVVE